PVNVSSVWVPFGCEADASPEGLNVEIDRTKATSATLILTYGYPVNESIPFGKYKWVWKIIS
ncbi:MAG: hypothetical protein ACHQ1D_10875, partial [Nitrososphaerales archaeon]